VKESLDNEVNSLAEERALVQVRACVHACARVACACGAAGTRVHRHLCRTSW
jgi:hypothetical protein